MQDNQGCFWRAFNWFSAIAVLFGFLNDLVSISERVGGKEAPLVPRLPPPPSFTMSFPKLPDLTQFSLLALLYLGIALPIQATQLPPSPRLLRTVAFRTHIWLFLVLLWAAGARIIASPTPRLVFDLLQAWLVGFTILAIWHLWGNLYWKPSRTIGMLLTYGALSAVGVGLAWALLINITHGDLIISGLMRAGLWSGLGCLASIVVWLSSFAGVNLIRPLADSLKRDRSSARKRNL